MAAARSAARRQSTRSEATCQRGVEGHEGERAWSGRSGSGWFPGDPALVGCCAPSALSRTRVGGRSRALVSATEPIHESEKKNMMCKVWSSSNDVSGFDWRGAERTGGPVGVHV